MVPAFYFSIANQKIKNKIQQKEEKIGSFYVYWCPEVFDT